MSEIDSKKEEKKEEQAQPADAKGAASGEVKDKKKSKKTAAVEEQVNEEEELGSTALRPDSDEIGKCQKSQNLNEINDEYLVTTTELIS